ncbi:unnamed protein product [Arctogadus glacialis]
MLFRYLASRYAQSSLLTPCETLSFDYSSHLPPFSFRATTHEQLPADARTAFATLAHLKYPDSHQRTSLPPTAISKQPATSPSPPCNFVSPTRTLTVPPPILHAPTYYITSAHFEIP